MKLSAIIFDVTGKVAVAVLFSIYNYLLDLEYPYKILAFLFMLMAFIAMDVWKKVD